MSLNSILFFLHLISFSLYTNSCNPSIYPQAIIDPCSKQMNVIAPDTFNILFGVNKNNNIDGPGFTAYCNRNYAPLWVDRIYNLVLNGYYDNNYFFRVINDTNLKIIQFGTNGIPKLSNIYNWNSTDLGKCAILEPQPDEMPININGITGLSNTFGTISMSTSSNPLTNKTWNATAELFINTGNNSWLDPLLFVPICTISEYDMNNFVLKFPSFGECSDLGGPGPSISKLYAEGNSYIQANSSWDNMAMTSNVRLICNNSPDSKSFNQICGPCANNNINNYTLAYFEFDYNYESWVCPKNTFDTCN